MRNKYKNNFLDTWKSVKDIFIKPNLRFYFGPWRKEGNLPVWRRGPQIRFGKYGEIDEEWNWAKLESAKWNALGKRNHPILSKIIKTPVWQLPIWLAFHWYNDDIMYKTKWEEDDFRYEFPAHFTIVFFGLAFSITAYLKPSDKEDWLVQDQYWESILTYKYYDGDLEKTNAVCGWYNRPGEKGFRFKFEPRFLKRPEDREKLQAIQNELIPEIIEKYKKEDEERLANQLFGIDAKVGNVNDNKFDGWFYAKYNNKLLVYENEEDRDEAYDNLHQEIQKEKDGEWKKIEYVKVLADKRYISNIKTWRVVKSDLIDKNIDIAEKVYENT